MSKKQLSTEVLAQIKVLSEEGYSTRAIAARLRLVQSTVSRNLAFMKKSGTFTRPKRPGRPKSTSVATDRAIVRHATRTPTASSTAIRASIPAPSPSARTIRRRLYDAGLKSYRPAKKPALSQKNIRDRIAFCNKYKHWTAEDWARVMFSDESTITQHGSYVRHVRRPKNTRFCSRYVLPTVKQPPRVMVWGAIAKSGRCGLWFMPKNSTINGTTYLSILEEKLPPFMRMRNCDKFLHDGAPCHRTKTVSQWLTNSGIEVVGPWPGNSPDLNPIENAWQQLKAKVAQHNATSAKDLIEKIKQVWCLEITPEYCDRLVSSMPARIAAVIANKGKHCKY